MTGWMIVVTIVAPIVLTNTVAVLINTYYSRKTVRDILDTPVEVPLPHNPPGDRKARMSLLQIIADGYARVVRVDDGLAELNTKFGDFNAKFGDFNAKFGDFSDWLKQHLSRQG